ncbi:MAG: hypothetical protein JWM12_3393 [Ilumatobacteraceae bacterium]|nr:hypothetical protein [Ilumatobacteraceae bacterium]
MPDGTTSFAVGDEDPSGAVRALAELGFRFDEPRTVTSSLLDTFDGRLHRAGLRLELHQGESAALVMAGTGRVQAHLPVGGSVPRRVEDLPRGPFRGRLAAIVDVRALLPQLRVTSTRTTGRWLDRAGKTVVGATIHTGTRIVDHEPVDAIGSMIEIDELVGYEKRAHRATEVLERFGLVPYAGAALELVAAAIGLDRRGFTDSATVPLEPTMPSLDGFRAVLANLAATIVANWQGTTERLDTEFLHDLRVAIRRTRSVVAQGKRVLPHGVAGTARERFGWLGGLTAPARDLDVYLIEWNGYTASLGRDALAALEPVHALLQRRCDAAYVSLVAALRSPEAPELISWWENWLSIPVVEPGGLHAGRELGTVVGQRIARAQATLIARGRAIGPEAPAEAVHTLRKDAKKLRYALECFAGVLPTAPRKDFVQRLRALQDNLGEYQDVEVHGGQLREISSELHAGGTSADTMLAIGQLTERLERRGLAARAEFTERFASYDTDKTRRLLDSMLDGIRR